MRISHGRSGAPSIEQGPTFSGQVWADPVFVPEGDVLVNNVFFEPRSRTHWHRHGIGQVLYVTIGAGWVQKRGGEGFALRAGDVVHIAAGEEHWHGARPDGYLSHLAISIGSVDWLDPVADEDYDSVF